MYDEMYSVYNIIIMIVGCMVMPQNLAWDDSDFLSAVLCCCAVGLL